MSKFISEDDIESFDIWLQYQGINSASLSADDLKIWKDSHNDAVKWAKESPKVGVMLIPPMQPGENFYAVAVEGGENLWLALWVKRSVRGDFYVLIPRGNKSANHHTSYHCDGTFHSKDFGCKSPYGKRQATTGIFRGIERLGTFGCHAPKLVGAICEPSAFSGVVRVKAGLLGPKHGRISVDLIEPDFPLDRSEWEHPRQRIESQHIFGEGSPRVVITVLASIHEDAPTPSESQGLSSGTG